MRGWVLAGVVLAVRVALADTSAATHYKQGKAFEAAKQYDQAIAEYQAAYAIDRKPAHLYNIGHAHQLAGRAKQAIELYEKFLDADPQNPLAKEVRETVVALTKELAEAEAKAEAEKKRLAADSHVKLAQAYAKGSQWIDAGNEYRAAFDADGDAVHLRDAGDAYAKADPAKARDAYLAYLDKVPGASDADAIRARIAALPKPKVETPKPKTDTAITIIASRPDAKILIDQQEKGTGKWSGSLPAGGHSLRVVAPGARIYQTELVVEDKPRTIEVPLDAPPEDLGPRFRIGLSITPGVELVADNPSVLLVRADFLARIGRRVLIGPVAGYGIIAPSGGCAVAGGETYEFSSCRYLLFGVEVDLHLRPQHEIDPYLGFGAAARLTSVRYEDVSGPRKDVLGIALQAVLRGGVDYHPSSRLFAWTIGAYAELQYGPTSDHIEDPSGFKPAGPIYPSVFGGGRTAFAF